MFALDPSLRAPVVLLLLIHGFLTGCSSSGDTDSPGATNAGSPAVATTMATLDVDVAAAAPVNDHAAVVAAAGDATASGLEGAEAPVDSANPFELAQADGDGSLLIDAMSDSGGGPMNDPVSDAADTSGGNDQGAPPGNATDPSTDLSSGDSSDPSPGDSPGDSPDKGAEQAPETGVVGRARVLLFSETRGFRHGSIPAALDAYDELAAAAGIGTDRAGDSDGVFTDANLARYDAVIFVLTSGDVLNADEQAVFERYIRAGNGFAGVHAASDTEYDWPWYGELVGAWFERHPEVQSATQIIEDGSHPSTTHLGATWTRTDEWYDYRANPRSRVNVLLTLDETSYTGGGMGDDHPSAWYHAFDGGRSWYTGGGHLDESYAEPAFRAHLLGGLRYAAGLSGDAFTNR